MAHIINNPHALYYNGELIGIITNPDPFPGGIEDIIDSLSPEESGICVVRPMHQSSDLVECLKPLPETIPVEREEEDTPIHPNDLY